ncbi:MAG: nucleotidyltransferase domain-containing protein [Lewinellaceae bacterium]|nr:nucleotidyltransferase domain-containing protein [Phaeodactylibacter sp.]MCB9347592.1 nucleotidyltransferase domain-containing protein [Lewinellaceae bacterium]
MKYGLKEHTIEKMNGIFAQFPEVEKVMLYGSRAKGTYRPGSDIDLTLLGPALNLKTLFRIETELDDLLLPYMIDLSIFEHIDNPNLIDHIRRVGKVFYQREEAGAEY